MNNRFAFVKNTISNLPKVARAKFLGSETPFYWHKQVWQPQEASWKMKIGLLQGIFYRGTGSILEFEGSVQHAHKGHPNLVT